MVDGFSNTPRYVLKDGSRPFCPSVSQTSSDDKVTVVFGFSDKPQYDAFMSHCSVALTPYPLVKGYLKNQIDADSNADSHGLKLIVLDAVGPTTAVHYAATMQDVLESFDGKQDSVAVSYRLVLDEASESFQLESWGHMNVPHRS